MATTMTDTHRPQPGTVDRRGQMQELTLIAPLKPGGAERVRQLLATLDLYPILAKSPVLHNLRFVVIDNDSRMLLATVFDGDWDQYLEDFGPLIGDAVDAIGSQWEGYPGSLPAGPFKEFIRKHQVPANGFYFAYPEGSVKDIRKALRLKRSLDQVLDEVQS